MQRVFLRAVRVSAAIAVASAGALAYGALTEMAGAAPPPVVNSDYAAYPPTAAVPAGCTGGLGGAGVLVGYRSFIDPAGVAPARIAANPTFFADPGPGAAAGSMRRFQVSILPGDRIVTRWTAWAAGCDSLAISFPLKATDGAMFDITDDQALVREPNGPAVFPFCYSSGPESCPATGGGFELAHVIPQLNVVCGFQLDLVIGAPLETVGPSGSYYQNTIRSQATAMGLGTFNTNPPNMLIDAANGAMPCQATSRIVIDKQWVGTGATPPSNVPPGFVLTVTSSASQTDPTTIGTATCTVTGGVFACDYRDAADPSVPQGGLLVNANSLLIVTETGFPDNVVDITAPQDIASKYISCPAAGGPCLFTITNTPPPPPPPTTEPTTTPPPTPAPPTDTPPSLNSTALTMPPTLPPTGASGVLPFSAVALVLLPLGAVIVMATRRRATD